MKKWNLQAILWSCAFLGLLAVGSCALLVTGSLLGSFLSDPADQFWASGRYWISSTLGHLLWIVGSGGITALSAIGLLRIHRSDRIRVMAQFVEGIPAHLRRGRFRFRRRQIRQPHNHRSMMLGAAIVGIPFGFVTVHLIWPLVEPILPRSVWSSYWLNMLALVLSPAVIWSCFGVWVATACEHRFRQFLITGVFGGSCIASALAIDFYREGLENASWKTEGLVLAYGAGWVIVAVIAAGICGLVMGFPVRWIGYRLVEHDGRLCSNCHYSLEESESRVCPECGTSTASPPPPAGVLNAIGAVLRCRKSVTRLAAVAFLAVCIGIYAHKKWGYWRFQYTVWREHGAHLSNHNGAQAAEIRLQPGANFYAHLVYRSDGFGSPEIWMRVYEHRASNDADSESRYKWPLGYRLIDCFLTSEYLPDFYTRGLPRSLMDALVAVAKGEMPKEEAAVRIEASDQVTFIRIHPAVYYESSASH